MAYDNVLSYCTVCNLDIVQGTSDRIILSSDSSRSSFSNYLARSSVKIILTISNIFAVGFLSRALRICSASGEAGRDGISFIIWRKCSRIRSIL